MVFGKSKLELKVGVFVFFGLVIMIIFVLSIGGFKSWSSGHFVKFNFGFINGVKVGAPVRFAGVDVGQVKKLNFFVNPDNITLVEIVSWVKDGINIPSDSTVWVNTLGLLGEKYIEILPGKDQKKFLIAGDTLTGMDPIAMHEMERTVRTTVADIDSTVQKINKGEGTIGKLFADDTIYKNIADLTLDLKKHPWKLFWKGKE